MPLGRGRTYIISELTVDEDVDFLGLYQAKNLASPASGEALRRGYSEIRNAEIHPDAAIAESKLSLAIGTLLLRTLSEEIFAAEAVLRQFGDDQEAIARSEGITAEIAAREAADILYRSIANEGIAAEAVLRQFGDDQEAIARSEGITAEIAARIAADILYRSIANEGIAAEAVLRLFGDDQEAIARTDGIAAHKALADAHHAATVIGDLSPIALANIVNTYLLPTIMTTRGDIVRRGASNPERLAKGASGTVLTMGADDSAWATPSTVRQIATGTYSGTDADDRQITTGFKCSIVLVFSETGYGFWVAMPDGTFRLDSVATLAHTTDVLLHASDGFVVDTAKANYAEQDPYNWWAISE